jgi:hypothetical protein
VHAALTALAFVLSSLFGLIHEGTTTHIRCAEHGELTHGVEQAVAIAAVDGDAAAAVVYDLSAARARHGHEHCLFACASRVPIVQSPPVLTTMVITGRAPVIAIPSIDRQLRGDLYRTAPKTSPPA